MKLSYRDKVVLIVLLVIAIWVVGVMYFIKPKFEELDTANKEYDEQVTLLNKKKDEIKQDEGLKEKVNTAYNEVVALADNFYDKMTTDEVSTTIDNILDEDEITNANLNISQYSQVTLAYIDNSPQAISTDVDRIASESQKLGVDTTADEGSSDEENPALSQAPVLVPAYTIDFNYSCELENLQSFLDKLLTRNQKSLVVTSCSITDINEDVIEGSMTLVLMMMPRMANPLEKNAEAAALAS